MRGELQCYASGMGRWYFRAAIPNIPSVSIIISLGVKKEIFTQFMQNHQSGRKCVYMRGELQCYGSGIASVIILEDSTNTSQFVGGK